MDKDLFRVKAVKPHRNAHKSFGKTTNFYCLETKHEDFEPLTTKNALKYLVEGSLKYKVCRYCLNVASLLSELDEIYEVARRGAIYKVTLRDMIAIVHPFKVAEDPNFPDKICSRCVESAITSYMFSQQCERAERALRNCFDDMYNKFEKLDPLERPKKRGRQKLNPNPNVLYAEHQKVVDYAEPIIHIINTDSTTLEEDKKISPLECPKCWQVLPDIESLLNHNNLHPKSMWYSCRLCGKSFTSYRHYWKHIRNVHKHEQIIKDHSEVNTSFKCNECGFISTSFGGHLQHVEKHKFKRTFEHLIDRSMHRLCAVCLEKSSSMIDMNETIQFNGGYSGVNNEQAIYNIVSSTFPEMTFHNYTGTHICEKCLDHAITSYVFITKIRHVRGRLYNCVSVMLDRLNEICKFDKNLMVEISQECILPQIKEEKAIEDDEDSSIDESKLEVDVLEDEFRIKSEESDSDSDITTASKHVDEFADTLDRDCLEIKGFIDNPAKKVTKTYVNKKLLNGYQPLTGEEESLNDVCEFLTFKKKQKVIRRSYKYKFTCPYCSKHFISDYFLKKHVLKHTISNVNCKLCKTHFKSKFHLFEHMKMVHFMKESCYNTCKVCGRMFNTSKKMRMHERTHKIKQCQLCDKYYSSQKHFDIHLQRHAIKLNMVKNWRIQTCSFCEKECANENELSLHVNKAHLHLKPYNCDMCERLFYSEYDLKNHKKVHSLLMKETCVFCKKTFKCRKSLVIHVRKHLGTKPHICQVCRQAFYSENRMKRHMVIYHGGRFCCRLCKIVLATKSELRTHISIEHNAM